MLNGTPRSGKSTIARGFLSLPGELWLNLGVDAFAAHLTPLRLWPGIGLRPGGERPDLEVHLPGLFDALYASVTAISRLGINVVVDVGHHDDFSTPLGILPRAASAMNEIGAYFIGVRCPVPVIMERRDTGESPEEDRYARSGPDGRVPAIVGRWERAVHDPGIYDLEVDTSVATPAECVEAIRARMSGTPPTAFAELAKLDRTG